MAMAFVTYTYFCRLRSDIESLRIIIIKAVIRARDSRSFRDKVLVHDQTILIVPYRFSITEVRCL